MLPDRLATRLKLVAAALPILLAAGGLAGCATNPVSGNPEVVLMSEAQELSLGRQADQDVKKQYSLYDHKGLQAWRRSHEGMRQLLRSFRALTAGERKLAQPLRIRLVRAEAGARFATLTRNSPLGANAEGWLRLVNALYPSGEPVAGRTLKVIE